MIIVLLLFIQVCYAIDLKDAINKALEYYPSLRALKEESIKFRGKALTYRSYLNPSLEVVVGNFGTSKESARTNPIYSFSYSQPFSLYPIGKSYKEMVSYEERAFLESIEQQKSLLISEVYLAYYMALYRKELLKVAKENYEISQELHSFIKRLFDLGEITKLEVFRSERELDLARVELEMAQRDYENALKHLSYFIGQEVEDLKGSFDKLHSIKEIDFEKSPRLRQYQYAIKGLEAGIEVEKALSKPQLSFTVIGEKASSQEYGFRMGLSATLPFFYRREGEILQLLAERKSMEFKKSLEELNLKRDYELVRSRYQKLLEEVERIEKQTIPKAQEELSLAIKSYKLRTITLLELTDIKRRYVELLKYRLELIRQLHEEYAKYLSLGGEL
ncbi:MAG: TolC family protein [Aquificaceae bacterium]